jgi:hypothetical protein
MAQCPACTRPVAMSRPTCVYCGAALPKEAVDEAAASAEAAFTPAASAAGPTRALLIVDFDRVSEAAAAETLGLSAFEAAQLLRRGGLQLHRIAEVAEAEAEAEALRRGSLQVTIVPEAEARTPVLAALGGSQQADGLRLRTENGPLTLREADLRLVVRGPIARTYQPSLQIRRLSTASLDGGYRIHLHRRRDPRPVELDPGNFEIGFAVTGSSLLEILGWLDAVAPGVPHDDGFRRLPPVMAPAAPDVSGVLAAAAPLRRPSRTGLHKDELPTILDNVAQFRFYSCWRAAVERRRRD